jgi:glutamyl-Q tRNA(Asp) synthetase
MPTRFRFAPSPNGFLHAGHALSAWLNLSLARRFDGEAHLRVEDIDTGRTRQIFLDGIDQDLAWLRFHFECVLPRQSTRFRCYAEAADTLIRKGLVYPCFCTRKDRETAAVRDRDPDGQPLYDQRCRMLGRDVATERMQAMPYALRIDMSKALEGPSPLEIALWDPHRDTVSLRRARPERWGDAVIVRKDTPSSYHLSVVVDDAEQGMTHVVRGADLDAATDLHRLLQHHLALPSPLYWNHSLLKDDEGNKLSKSAMSRSLRDWRLAGVSAQSMLALVRDQAGDDAALLVDPDAFP